MKRLCKSINHLCSVVDKKKMNELARNFLSYDVKIDLNIFASFIKGWIMSKKDDRLAITINRNGVANGISRSLIK